MFMPGPSSTSTPDALHSSPTARAYSYAISGENVAASIIGDGKAVDRSI